MAAILRDSAVVVERTRARLRNRCSCAVDFGSSSGLSIFKMVDGESKINTSLSWLLATSCSLKVFINSSTTMGNHQCRCFDCDRKDRNGVFSYIKRQRQLLQEETFSFCKFARGTVFPSFKVVPSSLRF